MWYFFLELQYYFLNRFYCKNPPLSLVLILRVEVRFKLHVKGLTINRTLLATSNKSIFPKQNQIRFLIDSGRHQTPIIIVCILLGQSA